MKTPEEIREALEAPFPGNEVKCRPGTRTKDGKKAMVIWYIDARLVMDRLDDVFGVMGWEDSYEVVFDKKAVVCTLRVWDDCRKCWVAKSDVGGESEQPDEGDRHKAAFSDALKRAAVKFGIGRYLYDVKGQWAEMGQYGFASQPAMPSQFLPKVAGKAPAKAQEAPKQEAPAFTDEQKRLSFELHEQWSLKMEHAKNLEDLLAIQAAVVANSIRKMMTAADLKSLQDYFVQRRKELEAAAQPS